MFLRVLTERLTGVAATVRVGFAERVLLLVRSAAECVTVLAGAVAAVASWRRWRWSEPS